MYIKFNNTHTAYEGTCGTFPDPTLLQFTLTGFGDSESFRKAIIDINSEGSSEEINVYDDPACIVPVQSLTGYKIIQFNSDIENDLIVVQVKITESEALAQLNGIVKRINELERGINVTALSISEINKYNRDLYNTVKTIGEATSSTAQAIKVITNEISPEEIDPYTLNRDEAIEYQLQVINKECNEYITNGIDVETSMGIEHFSLSAEDQINISSLYNEIALGATAVPYHADGKLCRLFSADEFLIVANAVKQFKIFCTTKCNYLRSWIKSAANTQEALEIHFNSELPEDLQKQMDIVLSGGQNENDNQETD